MYRLLLLSALLCSVGCGATPTTSPAKSRADYPYPECEAFIRKIKDESGEPGKVEIVKWVARIPGGEPGYATIVAMVRDTNKLGAREVTERRHSITPKD
jgi:hypothetical protein